MASPASCSWSSPRPSSWARLISPRASVRFLGPRSFPLAIAGAMAAGVAVVRTRPRRPPRHRAAASNVPDALPSIALLAVYLALWGFGGFAPRTLLFLALLLMLFGETWKRSLVYAAIMTAGVVAAFQYGLRVTLQ
ncbi:MAG: tripartite tricarboxylate transporter TctB family protein [Bryobacteraceae bacterium]